MENQEYYKQVNDKPTAHLPHPLTAMQITHIRFRLEGCDLTINGEECYLSDKLTLLLEGRTGLSNLPQGTADFTTDPILVELAARWWRWAAELQFPGAEEQAEPLTAQAAPAALEAHLVELRKIDLLSINEVTGEVTRTSCGKPLDPLACPFCGGRPEIRAWISPKDYGHSRDCRATINCAPCEIAFSEWGNGSLAEARAKVIARWNRRAS